LISGPRQFQNSYETGFNRSSIRYSDKIWNEIMKLSFRKIQQMRSIPV